jgi:DNA helicase-2/ATP-dependent DNA helicase PcrA
MIEPSHESPYKQYMKKLDLDKELNSEQKNAVQAPDGPVLVIAAAGTGKTRTLTYRVAHLIERGIPANRILLLTFTNRAAGEMMERARMLVGSKVSGLWGGTFHSVANRILRQHGNLLGYKPDYIIFDQDDAQRIIKNCSDELNLSSKHFPKPNVLQSLFSLALNKGIPVEDLATSRFACHDINIDDIMKVYTMFGTRKKEINGMDFDDLLTNVLLLFQEHEALCSHYQEHFRHVLVDEYQDTNAIQGAWVDMLAGRHQNLLVVGDDFQSIYSWRGANFRNIITFPERYPDAQVFKLETNYRSTPDILEIANKCIEGNPEQFQKVLRAMRKPHLMPKLINMRNGYEQASYIINKIHRLRETGYKFGDIAILYRSHFHAMELQMELNRSRINYSITSGIRFFEQAHIKDVCAIARITGNAADELSFRRILGFLPGVGPKTAAKIWIRLGRRCDPWDPDHLTLIRKMLPKKAEDKWARIQRTFDKTVRTEVEKHPVSLMEIFIREFYDGFAVETFDNYNRRSEDLEGMLEFASRYKSLQEFLHEMALQSNLDQEADKNQLNADDVVRLTTIHQAKGLEFPVVFILWLVDGMFPSTLSMDEPGGEAEERRLFYVATTRAKDDLFLCSPQMRRMRDGQLNYCMPSRFITELPESLLQYDL